MRSELDDVLPPPASSPAGADPAAGASADDDADARATPTRRERLRLAVVLLVLGVWGLGLGVRLTEPTIGATPDGSVYLGVAGNLDRGEGLTSPLATASDDAPPLVMAARDGRQPLIRWPPGYPVAVAATMQVTGTDSAHRAARVLAVALLAWNLAAVGWLTLRWTRSVTAALLVGLLVSVEGSWLMVHDLASSEQLLLAALLGAAICADRWIAEPRWPALAGAAACGFVAAQARYAGAAATAALAVTALVAARGRARWVGVGAAVVATLPAAWWTVSREQIEGVVDRRVYRPPLPGETDLFFRTLRGWLASPDGPEPLRWALLVLVLGLAVVGAGALGRRAVFGVYATAVGIALLVLSATWVRVVPMNGRLLTPFHPVVLALTATGVVDLARRAPRVRGRNAAAAGAALVGAVLVVSLATANLPTFLEVRPTASRPELTAFVRGLPDEVVVFSNAPEAVWGDSGEAVVAVPTRLWQENLRPNEHFDEWAAQVGGLIADGAAVAVIFGDRAFLDPTLANTPDLAVPGTTTELLDGVTVIRQAP
jgi:hypothetical protein